MIVCVHVHELEKGEQIPCRKLIKKLPGHNTVTQALLFSESPIREQSSPLFAGAGFVQYLFRT